MIFQAFHDKVRTDVNPDGPKTMTRRAVDDNDEVTFVEEPGAWYLPMYILNNRDLFEGWHIQSVKRNGRTIYHLGQQLANQPGRGKKANGRTPPVTEIRLERVGEITPEDCRAEGISRHETMPVRVFEHTWNDLHPDKGERWPDAPCYVINWGAKSK